MSFDDEFELSERPRPRDFFQPSKQTSGHSSIGIKTPAIHLDGPKGFVRELATLASTVWKTKSAELKEKLATFGKDMFPKGTRSKSVAAARTAASAARQRPTGADVNYRPPPATQKLTISQTGVVNVIGIDSATDKKFRNFTLVWTGVYCAAFLLLIAMRIIVPNLTITGMLFAGFVITILAAISAAIAWNYISGILGKVFFAALILCEVVYEMLLASQLLWGTVIACTVTLVSVFAIGLIASLLSNAALRKGTESFGIGMAIALVLVLMGLPYFIGVGGYGYLALAMGIGAIATSVSFVTMINTFFWEADTQYEGLPPITGGLLAFGKFSFVAFVILALLMGTFISLRSYGLSIGIPLFWTDTIIGQITIPATTFAGLF